MRNKILFILAIVIIATFGLLWKLTDKKESAPITNFEECVNAGNLVMESYPRQCRYNNQTFTENIGNENKKANLIRLNYPRPNQIIKSPLVVKGEARGFWFFEASFPVFLTDWDGRIIAQGIAQAKSDWMTEDFVPFEATLTFIIDKNVYSNRGALILKKDNPSGLPEHDDALEIPIIYYTENFNSKNASFKIEDKLITLVNGISEIEIIPNSASKIITKYFGNEVKGDLNFDGKDDVAFLITQDTGGSGTFYYAVVALKTETGYKTTNAFFIGDRIAPQSSNIIANELHINYAERKLGEPMTAQPSVGAVKLLKVTPDGTLTGLMR